MGAGKVTKDAILRELAVRRGPKRQVVFEQDGLELYDERDYDVGKDVGIRIPDFRERVDEPLAVGSVSRWQECVEMPGQHFAVPLVEYSCCCMVLQLSVR